MFLVMWSKVLGVPNPRVFTILGDPRVFIFGAEKAFCISLDWGLGYCIVWGIGVPTGEF
jgi:hypothetical protein